MNRVLAGVSVLSVFGAFCCKLNWLLGLVGKGDLKDEFCPSTAFGSLFFTEVKEPKGKVDYCSVD